MNLEVIKDYLKIDFNEDDELLEMFLGSARKYLMSAVECEKLDETDERVKVALLALVSDWYEHREYVGDSSPKVRYTIRSIVLQLQSEQEADEYED